MQSINLYNIQLSDLVLFLNVAKYGSFTKAGEVMFMSQSWVSKRINLMEQELGLILLIRNKREMVLTPAGRVLEQRLHSITDDLLNAVQEAHSAQTGALGSLRIGYLEWGNLTFLDILKDFIRENPQCALETYRRSFSELREDISVGRVDLIFTTSYDCGQFSANDFSMMNIMPVHVMAYMSMSNPLAEKESITMEELRSEPMLMVDQTSSPGYGAFIRELFIKHSIRPKIAQYAHDGGEHIGSLLIDKGILIASQFFLENSLEEDIARVPIRDEYIYVTAVWRSRNVNPVLQQFLDVLRAEMNTEEVDLRDDI